MSGSYPVTFVNNSAYTFTAYIGPQLSLIPTGFDISPAAGFSNPVGPGTSKVYTGTTIPNNLCYFKISSPYGQLYLRMYLEWDTTGAPNYRVRGHWNGDLNPAGTPWAPPTDMHIVLSGHTITIQPGALKRAVAVDAPLPPQRARRHPRQLCAKSI